MEGVGRQVTAELWAANRVLVTGATGMVGSWLVKELLERGAQVVVLVRDVDPQSELYRSGDAERVTVVNGRLEEYGTLERAINEHEIETVFHLGAQTTVGAAFRSPLSTFEANVRGTYNLLEACRVHSDTVKAIVVASSDKAYGHQANLPYTEDMNLLGRHPYEVSKSCADLLAQSVHHAYGLPVGIARCGNVYGGGDLNWNRIVPGTIRSFLEGDRPVIRSDGSYVRDYIYVKDAARAYVTLAEALPRDEVNGEAFNFGNETPVTVMKIFEDIQRLMKCEHLEPTVLSTANGEIHSQYLSASKARDILGWRPEHSSDSGLCETIDWYRNYFSQ